MLYPDTVDVWVMVIDGQDGLGNDLYAWHKHAAIPGAVTPLGGDQILDWSDRKVISRYRIIVAPHVVLHDPAPLGLRVSWGPYEAIENDDDTGLLLDGAVERHYLRGRLHHYEWLSQALSTSS